MTIYIEMGHVNIPYTYMYEWGNETFTSKLDHFIVCKYLCDNIGECFIIDEFYSDHAAVKISISVAVPLCLPFPRKGVEIFVIVIIIEAFHLAQAYQKLIILLF